MLQRAISTAEFLKIEFDVKSGGYFSKIAFYHVLGNFRGMVERIGKLGTALWENSIWK